MEDFVGFVKRSGLVEESQLERCLSLRRADCADGPALASALCAANLLTDWQSHKLLEGRYKGYFLGKYKLLRQLGAGAMGSVYLAEHRVMRHRVAIKVLARRLVGKQQYLQRFEQEARAAASVNHPRIVRAFDVETSGDTAFLVMEFVPGEELQKIVMRDGPLPVREAAECIRQTAEGLAAAHAAGLVHRDIKPSNLLLDDRGEIHILDLGLARLRDDGDTPSLTIIQDARMIGTVDYLSPEQARNSHDVDARSDLYSLGCTLFFLLTGGPPFNTGTVPQRLLAHQSTRPRNLALMRSDVPQQLAAIGDKLLAKLPEHRYQSANDVIVALAAYLQSTPDSASLPVSNRSQKVSRDDLDLAPLGDDTLENRLASSSTGGGEKNAMNNHSGMELELCADDDALATPQPILKPKPQPTAPSQPVAESPPLAPLASGDPFDDLLSGELPPLDLPEVDLAALPAADPLGISAASSSIHLPTPESIQSRPAESLASHYLRAAAQAESPPKTWHQRLVSLVASEGDGPGGLSYSLWFLVVFGILTGLILAGVGYSVLQSTQPKAIPHTNRES